MIKNKKNITILDFFDNYNDTSNIYNIDKETFKLISYLFFYKLSQEIKNGYIFNLFSQLGKIYIKKFKPKNKAIDWKLTNEYYGKHNKLANKEDKKYIYHVNNHTFGWSGRWYWDKKDNNFKNKTLYKFEPTRENSRSLAKLIKSKNIIDRYEN